MRLVVDLSRRRTLAVALGSYLQGFCFGLFEEGCHPSTGRDSSVRFLPEVWLRELGRICPERQALCSGQEQDMSVGRWVWEGRVEFGNLKLLELLGEAAK
jgi:hypothetical protein